MGRCTRVGTLGFVLVCATAWAHSVTVSPREALRNAPTFVQIRRNRVFSLVADELVYAVTRTQGATSSVSTVAGALAIDSSMGVMGPVFLTHSMTVGQGNTNVNVMEQITHLDEFDGVSTKNLQGPGLTLVRSVPPKFVKTETSGSALVSAVKLQYNFLVDTRSTVFSVTHGLTENLDISLALPVNSNTFHLRVTKNDTISEGVSLDNAGIGDLVVRLKYGFPSQYGIKTSFTLAGQFPTGSVSLLNSTGDYWLITGFEAARLFYNGRLEIASNIGITWDLTQTIRTQGFYGLGISGMIIPKRLVGVLEFLGRSDFDSELTPGDTGVLYLQNGQISQQSLLGLDFRRKDFLSLAFGLRFALGHGIMAFASGVYALNAEGLRDSNVTPTFGIGGNF